MSERRRSFRKNLRSVGQFVGPDRTVEFEIHNLSLNGLQAHFKDRPSLSVDQVASLRVPELRLDVQAHVVWISVNRRGGYMAGFRFDRVETENPDDVSGGSNGS